MIIFLKPNRFYRHKYLRRERAQRKSRIGDAGTKDSRANTKGVFEDGCQSPSPSNKGSGSQGIVSMEDYAPVTSVTKTDPVWAAYVRETQPLDKEMLEAWSNNMDVLLVFAGLFSAILTAFLVEVHQALKQPPTDLTNGYLFAITERLDHIINNSTVMSTLPLEKPAFAASPRSIRINMCWFSSLSFSLFAAAGAMVAKQWFREYSRGSTAGSYYDQAQLRQHRFDGLKTWRFEEVVELLPTFMHIALLLFFAGLIDFLWDLYSPIATFIIILTSLLTTAVLAMNLASIYAKSCPYRTPFTKHIGRLCKTSEAGISRALSLLPQVLNLGHAAKRWALERRVVGESASDPTKATAPLVWLLQNSQDQDTTHTLLKLVPALLTTPDRRTQLADMNVISEICQLIENSHSRHNSSEDGVDTTPYYIALHAVLAHPSLPTTVDSELIRRLCSLAYEEHVRKDSDISKLVLSISLTLSVGDTRAFRYLASGVFARGALVASWARVAFLDAISTFINRFRMLDLSLEDLCAFIRSAPARHVSRELFTAFMVTLVAILNAAVTEEDPSQAEYRLSNLLVECLEAMIRVKESTREKTTSGLELQSSVNSTQTDDALTLMWWMVKTLACKDEIQWDVLVDKLVVYAHDSKGRASAVAMGVLFELQDLWPQKAEFALRRLPTEQATRLFRTCLINPEDPSYESSPQELRGMINCATNVLLGLGRADEVTAIQAILLEDKLYQLILWSGEYGCEYEPEKTTFRIIFALCGIKSICSGGNTCPHIDRLVRKGLLVRYIALFQRFIGGLEQGRQCPEWISNSLVHLAQCANPSWFAGNGMGLKDLANAAVAELCTQNELVQGLTTVFILLLWSSANQKCETPAMRHSALLDLMDSPIIQPLSHLAEWTVDAGRHTGLEEVCIASLTYFLEEAAEALESHDIGGYGEQYEELLRRMLESLDRVDDNGHPYFTDQRKARREGLRSLVVSLLGRYTGELP